MKGKASSCSVPLPMAHSSRVSLAARLIEAGEKLIRNGKLLEEKNEAFCCGAHAGAWASELEAMCAQSLDWASKAQQLALRGFSSSMTCIQCGSLVLRDEEDVLTRLGVRAVLIDLDGTVYTPSGLIDGADDFYAHLTRRRIPYCFVSNTGAKGAAGVREKLHSLADGFMFRYAPVDTSKVVTAAEVQLDYMARILPKRAKVFVVAGDSTACRPKSAQSSWWMRGLLERDADKVSTWGIRTYLSESEATTWAAAAAATRADTVFVALFSDGRIAEHVDPSTGEAGWADWSFDIIKKASFLLAHGASLVVTAEDPYNPSLDERYPGHVFPLPGPGMFSAMFRALMYPVSSDKIVVVGKGGSSGLLMAEALDRLKAQGHDGDRSTVLLIGDRFDTDVKAASIAGIRSCLVETGAHHRGLQPYYDLYQADYVCPSINTLVPSRARRYTHIELHEDTNAESRSQSSQLLAQENLGQPRKIPHVVRVPSTPHILRAYTSSFPISSAAEDEGNDSPHQPPRPARRRALNKLRAWTLRQGLTLAKRESNDELAWLLRDFFDQRKDDRGWLPRVALVEALQDLGLAEGDLVFARQTPTHLDVAPNCGGVSLAHFIGLVRRLLVATKLRPDNAIFPSVRIDPQGRSVDDHAVAHLRHNRANNSALLCRGSQPPRSNRDRAPGDSAPSRTKHVSHLNLTACAFGDKAPTTNETHVSAPSCENNRLPSTHLPPCP